MADRKTAILDAAIAVIARRGVRGLRVEEVAADAGVAVSLLYYHFGTRDGLVRATLDHANERTEAMSAAGDSSVEHMLLSELDASARDSSVVWGEVLASAVFEPSLRDQLRAANETWVTLVADRITADGDVRDGVNPREAAERLTALVDGVSNRWHAGLITRERAAELLAGGIARELRRP